MRSKSIPSSSVSSNRKGIGFIIGASSVGTLIEWYDFYLFGMLATIISKQFFPANSGTSALLSTLAIFAAGFIVRPFGAIVFGRLGDILGRKHTFLLTLVLMGGSTFLIGCVPGFDTIGWAAPLLVLILRLLQGLALGGEYGGAATYVAEHSPAHKRGLYTSFIQTTATLGLFLALGVILLVRQSQGIEKFSSEWGGWRYPFWLSLVLVVVSIFIRMKMNESPAFAKLKKEGKTSTNPLKESFGHKANFKMILLALFGAVMGQGVVWYTGQFYAQNFLETVCLVDFTQSRNILLVAIAFATPFFVVFGALSDTVGRKWIMLLGMLAAALSYFPIYKTMLAITQPAYQTTTPIAKEMSNNIPIAKYDAKKPQQIILVTKRDSVYANGTVFSYRFTDTLLIEQPLNTLSTQIALVNNTKNGKADTLVALLDNAKAIEPKPSMSFVQVAYSSTKTAFAIEKKMATYIFWQLVGLVIIQIIFVTMVYGPIAAFLVELFPTKIRYTSMSLPYHIGNGVFGGLVPFLATLIVSFTKSPLHPNGNPLAGLWYPVLVAFVCLVIGSVYLSNKIDENVMD